MESASARKRAQANDPIAPIANDLVFSLNQEADNLLNFAKYFGLCQAPEEPKITDIDALGFTLQFMDRKVGSLKEVRVQFNKPCVRRDDARFQIALLAQEAKSALEMDPDKTYVPPGRNPEPYFELPSVNVAAPLLTIWALLIIGTFVDPFLLPEQVFFIHSQLGGRAGFHLILRIVLFIHACESVVAIGYCLWGGVPLVSTIKWALSILVFGMGSLRLLVRMVVRMVKTEWSPLSFLNKHHGNVEVDTSAVGTGEGQGQGEDEDKAEEDFKIFADGGILDLSGHYEKVFGKRKQE
ncbi:uncharacterized protein BJ171DRAFT_571561 [Polychytrium aggregatum]|uniref:uncharacterized protein n=1 Tax=Polychytrium aggregatum TaxID=110093 RepID=UPI0022FE2691|nr:uncharacterized protein BJ171DRAFT_571561 [Polychytrium aggregatum]KAI9193649.1 hypothetical protein BJ171DRAFT_571561 [Polychytrium aggregatum]